MSVMHVSNDDGRSMGGFLRWETMGEERFGGAFGEVAENAKTLRPNHQHRYFLFSSSISNSPAPG